MSILVGDTNGNGTVNASDVSQTKAQTGQAVTASNFRADVTANGVINASDVSLGKIEIGHVRAVGPRSGEVSKENGWEAHAMTCGACSLFDKIRAMKPPSQFSLIFATVVSLSAFPTNLRCRKRDMETQSVERELE